MEETSQLRAARAMRRAMLGDAYVDSMTADPDPIAQEFQDYLTSMAWGVWTRGGGAHTARQKLARHGHDGGYGPNGRVFPSRRKLAPDRRHRRGDRRASVSDRGVLRCAGWTGGPAGYPRGQGGARRSDLIATGADSLANLTGRTPWAPVEASSPGRGTLRSRRSRLCGCRRRRDATGPVWPTAGGSR